LRHTCASRLAQAGVDIKRIQEFLGHKTLAMTLRYAHLTPKHLQVCADVINEINDLSQAARQPRQAGAMHECMV
jgi:integrase